MTQWDDDGAQIVEDWLEAEWLVISVGAAGRLADKISAALEARFEDGQASSQCTEHE